MARPRGRRFFLGVLVIVTTAGTACGSFTGTDANSGGGGGGPGGAGGDGGDATSADGTTTNGTDDAGGGGGPTGEGGGSSLAYKRVFATSLTYVSSTAFVAQPYFQSISDATNLCNTHASTSSKAQGGTYRAWLSSATESPSKTFAQSSVAYMLVDGTTVVASNWTDLLGGAALMHTISKDEDGDPVTGDAWTGTTDKGVSSGTDCVGWTTMSSGQKGTAGSTTVAAQWTSTGSATCDQPKHIYCFEQ